MTKKQTSSEAEKFLSDHPTLSAALKSCHANGMTPEQAAEDPDVKAAAHKDGCILLIAAVVAAWAIFANH